MLLEAKLSPMNLGDQRFAIEMRSLKRPGYQGVYREQSAKPEALLLVCPSSVPDEVTAMSNPTSQMSSQVTISPQSKAAYLWRRPHEDFEKSDSRSFTLAG